MRKIFCVILMLVFSDRATNHVLLILILLYFWCPVKKDLLERPSNLYCEF